MLKLLSRIAYRFQKSYPNFRASSSVLADALFFVKNTYLLKKEEMNYAKERYYYRRTV
jgi:hypothetical protein